MKLMKIRTRGKGSVRRKKKTAHTATNDMKMASARKGSVARHFRKQPTDEEIAKMMSWSDCWYRHQDSCTKSADPTDEEIALLRSWSDCCYCHQDSCTKSDDDEEPLYYSPYEGLDDDDPSPSITEGLVCTMTDLEGLLVLFCYS